MRKLITIAVLVLLLTTVFTACTVPNTEIIQPPDNPSPPSDSGDSTDDNPPEESTPIIPDDPHPDEPPNDDQKLTVKYIRSKVNALNVRLNPSTASRVLGNIDKNELMEYHGSSGSYYITKYKNTTAYITANAKYTEIILLDSSENAAIERAVGIGAALLGMPYEFGAERLHWGNGILNPKFTGNTYDCSSLMQYMFYKSNQTLLEVNTRKQVLQGQAVEKTSLKRGDLLFFTNSTRYNYAGVERIGHVGVYLGDNYMLHTASDHALIEPVSAKRWSYYVTARRIIF